MAVPRWSWILALLSIFVAAAPHAFPCISFHASSWIQRIVPGRIGFAEEHGDDVQQHRPCFPAIFSFGSSVADTGNYATLYPSRTRFPTSFKQSKGVKSSQRMCDGRLLIDFWAQALHVPTLRPYLRAIEADFKHGVNFAFAGATAQQEPLFGAYSLSIQLDQFKAFKEEALLEKQPGNLPSKDAFENGLYIIAIGGNDLVRLYFDKNMTLDEVRQFVPDVSQAIVRTIKELYKEGARTIFVEGVFPQGCTPYILTRANISDEDLDAAGCSEPHNNIVKLHNKLLEGAILELNTKMENASIIFVDTYSGRYGIIANASLYGFTEPMKACCGNGEKYNFDVRNFCGFSQLMDGKVRTADSCPNPEQHVSWDGIHFTDRFNYHTMRQILTEAYFHPEFRLSELCGTRDLAETD